MGTTTKKFRTRRLLYLSANPVGTEALPLSDELAVIQDALGMHSPPAFELVTDVAVTPERLAKRLTVDKPDIIHFAGHGMRDGSLVLKGVNNNIAEMPAEAFAGILKDIKNPARLLILNACYTDVLAEPLRGTFDCIVGSIDAIPDATARQFASAFYMMLGKPGISLDVALRTAHRIVAAEFPKNSGLHKSHFRDGFRPDKAFYSPDFQTPPTLGVRFLLNKRGIPEYDPDYGFNVEMYVRHPPPEFDLASYIIDHQSFRTNFWECDDTDDQCRQDIWTYGSVDVRGVVWTEGTGIPFRSKLIDGLMLEYPRARGDIDLAIQVFKSDGRLDFHEERRLRAAKRQVRPKAKKSER